MGLLTRHSTTLQLCPSRTRVSTLLTLGGEKPQQKYIFSTAHRSYNFSSEQVGPSICIRRFFFSRAPLICSPRPDRQVAFYQRPSLASFLQQRLPMTNISTNDITVQWPESPASIKKSTCLDPINELLGPKQTKLCLSPAQCPR